MIGRSVQRIDALRAVQPAYWPRLSALARWRGGRYLVLRSNCGWGFLLQCNQRHPRNVLATARPSTRDDVSRYSIIVRVKERNPVDYPVIKLVSDRVQYRFILVKSMGHSSIPLTGLTRR